MKYFSLVIITLLLSCAQDNSIDPELFIPSSADLEDKFEFEFVSADTIRVFSNESADFVEPYFSSLILGYKNEDFSFVPLDTIPVKYAEVSNRYKMDFSCLCKISGLLDSYKFDHVEINLRLVLNQLDYRSIAFTVYPHKYPYETARIFLRKNDIKGEYSPHQKFNDIELAGEFMYFVTTLGGHLVYRYHLASKEIKRFEELDNTISQFCVYHDGFLYLDNVWYTDRISRLNLTTNVIESVITADNLPYSVHGIDIYQNKIYVLYGSDEQFLDIFEINGDFVESIPFPAGGNWSISIHNDIVYTRHSWDILENRYSIKNKEIRRFSLTEKKILQPLLVPSWDMDAIQVYDDKLYYSLYYSFLICYIPLSDLQEIN